MHHTKGFFSPVLYRAVRGLAAVGLALLVLVQGLAPAQAAQTRTVIPLGQAVGIKLFAQGVLVVGLQDLSTDQGLVSPAKACGLKAGDIITQVDGQEVNSIEEVQTCLQNTQDGRLTLTFLREEEETTVSLQAALDNGSYKLGAWIRDSMAGIGTLTFADPQTGLIATLGHGISDTDTSVLMQLKTGAITPAAIAGIVKGVDGCPGELRGAFAGGEDVATLYANTQQGVFGYLNDPASLTGHAVEVAQPEEVQEGRATILANIVDNEVEEYAVEITKVYRSPTDTRDLMLKVTDERLLEQTGGIVQGMSGSPILQNGKLVGAVTHVLVDHADQGYGILATHMLQAAESAQQDQAL